MDLERARSFLAAHHRAVMHTFRHDATPQLSPVVVTIDDEGRGMVSTRATAVKVDNLDRDPRTALCVFTDEFFGPWVRIDARAEIERLPQAMDGLVDYYRRLAGEHEDWDEYRRAMTEERRVLLRLTITAAGPDHSG